MAKVLAMSHLAVLTRVGKFPAPLTKILNFHNLYYIATECCGTFGKLMGLAICQVAIPVGHASI
jgi:hypothetical protein